MGNNAELYGQVRKWGSIGFIIGVFSIGALLEIIGISMLPIMLLCTAFITLLWSFTIKEPQNASQSQKHLESLLPVFKKPMVAAFFCIEFIMLFAQAPFYSFYSNYLKMHDYSTVSIGFLWSVGVIAEIIMFAYASVFLKKFSWRIVVSLCLSMTGLRFMIVVFFPDYFFMQLFSQSMHAFSFGLFHMVAMRIIYQNFSVSQQGRGQALYSTMWGLGVAVGSLLAGHYWQDLGGEMVFILAGCSVVIGLLFIKALPPSIHV